MWSHPCYSTTKKYNKSKKYNLRIECLLTNKTSNCFKFIMTPLRKTCGLRSYGTITHTSRKTKDSRLHALVTYATWALIVGKLSVIVKVSKGAMFGLNIYWYLWNLIKAQIVYKPEKNSLAMIQNDTYDNSWADN